MSLGPNKNIENEPDQNSFYSHDGTLTDTRTIDADGHDLILHNGTFILDTNTKAIKIQGAINQLSLEYSTLYSSFALRGLPSTLSDKISLFPDSILPQIVMGGPSSGDCLILPGNPTITRIELGLGGSAFRSIAFSTVEGFIYNGAAPIGSILAIGNGTRYKPFAPSVTDGQVLTVDTGNVNGQGLTWTIPANIFNSDGTIPASSYRFLRSDSIGTLAYLSTEDVSLFVTTSTSFNTNLSNFGNGIEIGDVTNADRLYLYYDVRNQRAEIQAGTSRRNIISMVNPNGLTNINIGDNTTNILDMKALTTNINGNTNIIGGDLFVTTSNKGVKIGGPLATLTLYHSPTSGTYAFAAFPTGFKDSLTFFPDATSSSLVMGGPLTTLALIVPGTPAVTDLFIGSPVLPIPTAGGWNKIHLVANTGLVYNGAAPKGNILSVGNNTAYTPFATGTNGQILMADSTQTQGLRWSSYSYGELVYTSGVLLATPIIVNTPTLMDWTGATTMSSADWGFTTAGNGNRGTYSGTINRLFRICVTLSVQVAAGAGKNCTFVMYANGVTVMPKTYTKVTLDATWSKNIVMQQLVLVTPGDYYEVFCENNTDGTSIVLEYGNFEITNVN